MTPGKRLFDLFGAAALALVLALPFAALLAVLLAAQGRPLFYAAERMGAPDRAFRLWKLRSMAVGTPADGVSGGDKAQRITPLGHFLRRTRADEIPQLWNVLKGDMSLVGPRPPARRHVERFPEVYAKILRARPGLTGLASVIYFRHEERLLAHCRTAEETEAVYARRCIPAKARLEMIYQSHAGVRLDLAILGMTLQRLLWRPALQRRASRPLPMEGLAEHAPKYG